MIRIGQVKRDSTATCLPLVFVRPRHLDMAKLIAQIAGVHNLVGFVVPKVIPGDTR
ncbi:hypothetical protein HFN84_36180 [Rhizobium laguerreae]|nr:hypothetical protein [Rhizobium laguerreae]MBY3356068.1 hypothetical protein [Rhizobium laguerreae]MBY3377151.1 hypothetical protein [Rhizobium laguerreae]MBY3390938.1 hypothetical protein [Rhizobium laguerreae]MBY3404600.1 hypothetical protein [Rhizobium laguerreae]